MRMSRRHLLGITGLTAAAGSQLLRLGDRLRTRPAAARASHLQVAAHADDDLYFMNPDVSDALRGGDPVMTVYLLAGEADGKNIADDDPGAAAHPADQLGYAAARQIGITRAYALMRTGDPAGPWDRTVHRVAGRLVEIASLRADPTVRLVFCSLRVSPATPDGRPGRWLRTCWQDSPAGLPTLLPTDSPVPAVEEWSREDVIAVLADLMRLAGATVVRTLDLDPEHTAYDGVTATYDEHRDHTAAAFFATAAARRYAAGAGTQVVTESYRGYSMRRWPRNLSPDTFAAKKSALDVYGGATDLPCTTRYGCGDHKIGDRAHTRGYGQSMVARHAESTSWLVADGQARLTAVAVVSDRLTVWRQERPGGRWQHVQTLPGGDLLPHLSAVCGPDGRITVVGMRRVLDPDPRRHRLELVTSGQDAGHVFGPWQPAGNPADGRDDTHLRQLEMGPPAAATAADGSLWVFVRNFGRGVSARTRGTGGTWSSWQDLGGSRIQEGLSAVRGPGGRLELFAGSATHLMRWTQDEHGAFRAPAALAPAPPAGAVTSTVGDNGRLLLAFREPQTGSVLMLRQRRDGTWPGTPARIGGEAGTGAVAATGWGSRAFMLLKRNGAGGCSLSVQPLGTGASTRWDAGGPPAVHSPAVAVDADGALVMARIGTDASLWTWRIGATRPIPAHPGWEQAPTPPADPARSSS